MTVYTRTARTNYAIRFQDLRRKFHGCTWTWKVREHPNHQLPQNRIKMVTPMCHPDQIRVLVPFTRSARRHPRGVFQLIHLVGGAIHRRKPLYGILCTHRLLPTYPANILVQISVIHLGGIPILDQRRRRRSDQHTHNSYTVLQCLHRRQVLCL